MMVNRYHPHVLVLPEDDANRQMANGFVLGLDPSVIARIQILEEAGGWGEVLKRFVSVHVGRMNRFTGQHVVLLIDFDGSRDRLRIAQDRIPKHLIDRVFVLGVLTEPEALKGAGFGPYETIGREMAKDCRERTDTIWTHELLRHNSNEIERLRQHVRPILFQ